MPSSGSAGLHPAMLRLPMVWRVAARDLLATLRDQRTLASTILMPLLVIPLLTMGMPMLLGKLIGTQQETRQRVGVVGTLPPALQAALTQDERGKDGKITRAGMLIVPVPDAQEAVKSGVVDAALRAATPLPQQAGSGTGELELYAKLGNLKTQTGAYAKVKDVVDGYNRTLTLTRLRALGLSDSVLTPVHLRSLDASPTQEKRSGQLAFLIPMLMLQFILSGAMATALDATAGEKERGTLESLLVSPVRRSEVVAGKLLATTLTALVTALFSLMGFMLAGLVSALLLHGKIGGQSGQISAEAAQMMGGQLTLNPAGFGAMLLIVVSAALIISGLLIALSIYARSYKEAQTYVAPLSMLIVFPAVALQFSDFLRLGDVTYLVPIFGSMVAILDIVKGNITALHVLSAVAANVVGAAVLGWLALQSFGREEVIFRN